MPTTPKKPKKPKKLEKAEKAEKAEKPKAPATKDVALPKGRVRFSQSEVKREGKRVIRGEQRGMPQYTGTLASEVLQNEDLLSVILKSIGEYDLGLLLDKCTLVCKLWHRIVRYLPTPDKELRDWIKADNPELTPVAQIRVLCALYHTDDTPPFYTATTVSSMVQQILKEGGWMAREQRRKRGIRVWHEGKTWTVPEAASVDGGYALMRFFRATSEEFRTVLYGTEEQKEAFWRRRLVVGHEDSGVILNFFDRKAFFSCNDAEENEEDVELYPYVQVRCFEEASRHPILVSVPPKTYAEARRAWENVTVVHPGPIDAKAQKWELLRRTPTNL